MTFKIWGTEDLTRTVANKSVNLPAITALANGGYVAMWLEAGEKFFYQVYDGNGVKTTAQPLQLQAGSTETPRFAQVTAIGTEGNFTVTWSEGGTSNVSLFSRMYDASGTAIANTTTTVANGTGKSGAQLTANSDTGGWGTAYIDNGKVKLSVYNAAGATGAPIEVFDAGGNTDLDVAWLGGIKYAVAYRTNNGIKAKIVGTAVPEISLDAAQAFDIIALNDPATGKPNGEFVVISDTTAPDLIVAQRYDAAGAKVGNQVVIGGAQINSAEDTASAIALKNGGYAIAYIQTDAAAGDQGDVYVKVVDVNGTAGPAMKINARANLDSFGTQRYPSISEMADGRLSITWLDPTGSAGNSSNISSTIVDARVAKITVAGTSKNDVYAPSEFTNDSLDAKGGIDTLTFKGTTTGGVAVNLGTESGSAGDAKNDVYKNFENIIGSRFSDTLIGDGKVNNIQGGDGNDVIDGGGNADVMSGGTGADTYYVDNSSDQIGESTAANIDTVYTYASYALSAYVENMTALGANAIVLTGNAWNNTLIGNAANNTLVGGDGVDALSGSGGDDVMDAGTGNDALDGGSGNDNLAGGSGLDNLQGGSGDDTLDGGSENDVLDGGDGADSIIGADGNDVLRGGGGNDTLNGGAGDDAIDGGAGADVMDGGAGNDSYVIDDAGDVVRDTGGGLDTVTVTVSYDLNRLVGIENITGVGTAAFTFTGTADNNIMNGSDGINILDGAAGNDTLRGNGGNDTLKGGAGIDWLDGGAGRDTIYGQDGNDVLSGGADKDYFVFDKRPNKRTNVDKILDYNVRDDSIYLENSIFKVGSGSLARPKQMASKYFYKGSKAHDRDDRIIYDQKKGVLYYDKDGTGSSAAVKIATFDMNKKPALVLKDFFVI
jgi:Ca2+-binding RTX toxin-like protein